MKKHTLLILAFISSLLLYNCKVDIDNSTKVNHVELTIKTDDDTTALNDAIVFIYDSEDAFKTDYKHQNLFDTNNTTAIYKGRLKLGKFKVDLNPTKKYWIRATAKKINLKANNINLLSSNVIEYSNDENEVTFGPFDSNTLNENMTTKATIYLTKAYNFLIVAAHEHAKVKVFNSKNEEVRNLNIRDSILANFDISTIDTNTTLDKANLGYLIYKVPKGWNKIEVISANGCYNLDSVQFLGGGTNVVYKNPVCGSCSIVFYNQNVNLNDIVVVISPNDTIGMLTSFDNTTNSSNACSKSPSSSLIRIGRRSGSYSYYVYSKTSNKTDPGQFQINAGECKSISVNPQ